MTAFQQLPHLARRFVGALSARVEPAELAPLSTLLSPAEEDLFRAMRVADQRHGLDLLARLRRDGHDDPDLLRAALLHDVGKSLGFLPLGFRVAYGLSRLISPRLAAWLGDVRRPRWCRPFYLAAHHAEVGARAARQAGSNPRVVDLIHGHDAPGSDELSRLLYRYDGQL